MKKFIIPNVENLPKSGIRKFFDLVLSAGPEVISLGVGEPDFPTPWHIRESMCFAIEKGFTSYTENAGLLELRQEISKNTPVFKKKFYNPKTEILVTNGVSEGMDLAFRTTVTLGKKILVPDPGYVMYSPLITLAGGIPIPYDPLDIKNIIIPQGCTGIVLNFPGNPMGNIFSSAELDTIAQLSITHDLLIYSDEIYKSLSFESTHISIVEKPGMRERTLLFDGLSKSHAMTGLRIGWVSGPEKIISGMTTIHQYSALCVSCISQLGAVEALRNGEEEMQKMQKLFNTRRKFCINQLNSIGLSYRIPQGAFYIFVAVPKKFLQTGGDDIQFCEQLLTIEKLALIPGSAFGKNGKNFIRMTYAASTEQLTEAFIRLEKFTTDILSP